jgi:hypothetical protein
MFKRCHRLVAGDGREIVEEFVERVAGLQIVVERFDRHPRADEYWGPTQHFAVTVNDGFLCHGRLQTWTKQVYNCMNGDRAPQVLGSLG